MDITKTRREGVARGFFWGLLLSILVLTGFFLVTGGPEKGDDKDHGQANVEQQIKQYRAALEQNPQDVETLITLGDLYLNTKNFMEALKIFTLAQKVAPDNAHVMVDLGGIYYQIGKIDKALESYERAYELSPSHLDPLMNMALIYSREKKDYSKAMELYRTVLDSNPEPQMAARAKQEISNIETVLKQTGGTSY
jgi:cytochrome c-type biogenesis protein CcmH/NrfG